MKIQVYGYNIFTKKYDKISHFYKTTYLHDLFIYYITRTKPTLIVPSSLYTIHPYCYVTS